MKVIKHKTVFEISKYEANAIATFLDLLNDMTETTDTTWEDLIEDSLIWWRNYHILGQKIFEGEFYDIKIVD